MVQCFYAYTYRHTYIHACMHAYIHTHIHTLHYIRLHFITLHYITSHYITIHTYMHACMHTYLCICSETVRSLVSATAVQDTELKALPNPPARTMPERGSLGVEASKRTNGFTVRGTALAGGACSNEHSTARNNFQIHRFDPTCPQHSATWDQVGAGRLLPCNKAGTWAQLGPTWLQLSTLLGLAEAWFSSMFAMLGLRWAYSNQAGPSCAGLTWLGSACAYHGFNLGPPGSAWPQNHANTCKYTENQVVWTITIRTLNLDLVPRSCKYIVNQVSGFSPKIMQKQSKPGSLEEQDPKSEIFKIEFGPKIPAPTKLWKCQQVMLNVHLLAKSMWIWSQDHANEL